MKNKFKSIFKILTVVTGCLMFASFSPSLDGRAVVVESGEYPQGYFAKTVGYLPGDIISVTNIAGDKTIDILVIGAIDPSEGVAIMLSPEAAEAIGIDKSSNNIVKITKRSGQDERVYGNAVISKSSASSDAYDENLDSIGEVENTEAFEEAEAPEPAVAEEAEIEEPEPEVEETEEAPAEVEEEAAIEEETEAVEPEAEEAEIEESEPEVEETEEVPAEVEEEAFEEEEALEEEAVEEAPVEEETIEEEAFEEEEDLSEAFEDEVPEMSEAEPAIEEPEVEETPLEEAPLEEAEEETEENFDEEYADDQEFEEYPETPAEETFEEDESAALEEEPAAEAFEEDKPEALAEELPSEEAFEEDALDELEELPAEAEAESSETEEYEAIVLVPAESNPPEASEIEETVAEELDEVEEVGIVEDEAAIILEPEPVAEVVDSVSKASNTSKNKGSYEKYLVPSLKALESGKYYIQIAVYSSDENINNIINTYGTNYPITIVPMAGGVSKQVLIGPLSMDEYKVVLERFKSYGFKDAFLRKVR